MKKGFFEMEMVSLEDLLAVEQDLQVMKCRYVVDHSDAITFNNTVLYESVSLYGEFPDEYEEYGLDEESPHGYCHLKDEYEGKYGMEGGK